MIIHRTGKTQLAVLKDQAPAVSAVKFTAYHSLMHAYFVMKMQDSSRLARAMESRQKEI